MAVSPDVGNKLLGWVMIGAGTLLAYSAVRNRKPWDVLRDIQGAPVSGATSGPSGFTGGNTAPTANFGQLTVRVRAIQNREIPPILVPIKPHGQLDKDAAASLARVQTLVGIVDNVGNYRSYAQQAGYYASDPKRYGSPDKSAHVVGLAIDIKDSDIARALAPMLAEGWQRARDDEPWHFSYLIRA